MNICKEMFLWGEELGRPIRDGPLPVLGAAIKLTERTDCALESTPVAVPPPDVQEKRLLRLDLCQELPGSELHGGDVSCHLVVVCFAVTPRGLRCRVACRSSPAVLLAQAVRELVVIHGPDMVFAEDPCLVARCVEDVREGRDVSAALEVPGLLMEAIHAVLVRGQTRQNGAAAGTVHGEGGVSRGWANGEGGVSRGWVNGAGGVSRCWVTVMLDLQLETAVNARSMVRPRPARAWERIVSTLAPCCLAISAPHYFLFRFSDSVFRLERPTFRRDAVVPHRKLKAAVVGEHEEHCEKQPTTASGGGEKKVMRCDTILFA
jgi:hypothetical protein